jgi:hypothetical protein
MGEQTFLRPPLELSREFLSGNWQCSTNLFAVQTIFFLFRSVRTYGLRSAVLCRFFISYFYAAAARVATERLRIVVFRKLASVLLFRGSSGCEIYKGLLHGQTLVEC